MCIRDRCKDAKIYNSRIDKIMTDLPLFNMCKEGGDCFCVGHCFDNTHSSNKKSRTVKRHNTSCSKIRITCISHTHSISFCNIAY